MNMHVPPVFRIEPQDRITLEGIAYRVRKRLAQGYVLSRVDDPGVIAEFTHQQLHELSLTAKFRFDRAAFDPVAAAARLEAEAKFVSELPIEDRNKVLWRQFVCNAFIKLEADGKASRSDASMKAARTLIQAAFDANEGIWSGRRNDKGEPIAQRAGDVPTGYKLPSPRTLRTWLKTYETAGLATTALRDKRFRCGDRITARHSPEIRKLLSSAALTYASESKPSVRDIYQKLRSDIDDLNVVRVEAGMSALPYPSYERLLKEVRSIPAYDVYSGRYGPAAAMKRFNMVANGVDIERPLQRVEIDEWRINLMTIIQDIGMLESLTPEQEEELRSRRFWACVAIDARTRVILGMMVAPSVSASLAKETLEMVVTPKSGIADAMDAQSPWDQHGSPESVVTDQGSTFMSHDFRRAVIDLGCDPDAPPAGMPWLRGTIERFFRTIDQQALGAFTGRTFANIAEKGDYDPVARASLTIEELCRALVRWVVDVYHNSPHAGLGGETPANAWRRLTAQYGVIPPPDRHVRRAIFGVDLQRTMSSRGVRVLGLFFNALELQAHRRMHGDIAVDVKLDPADLGHVSVRLGDRGWIAVPCMRPGLDDVPTAIWQAAIADLRRRFVAEAKLNDAVIAAAIRDAWEMARKAQERSGILSTRPTGEELDRVENHLGMGFPAPGQEEPLHEPITPQTDLSAKALPTRGATIAPAPVIAVSKPSRVIKPRN
jgi:putative transposase